LNCISTDTSYVLENTPSDIQSLSTFDLSENLQDIWGADLGDRKMSEIGNYITSNPAPYSISMMFGPCPPLMLPPILSNYREQTGLFKNFLPLLSLFLLGGIRITDKLDLCFSHHISGGLQ
jgi:hypothetical protein